MAGAREADRPGAADKSQVRRERSCSSSPPPVAKPPPLRPISRSSRLRADPSRSWPLSARASGRDLAGGARRFMIGRHDRRRNRRPLRPGSPRSASRARRKRRCIEGFCERAVAAGLPLARVIVFIDTLHPDPRGARVPLGARQAGSDRHRIRAHARKAKPPSAGDASPFYRMLERDESLLPLAHRRRRPTAEFPNLRRIWRSGR